MEELELARRVASNDEDLLVLRRVLDKKNQAQRGHVAVTHFLTDREQTLAQSLLRQLGVEDYDLVGGYPGAERAVLRLWPDWLAGDMAGEASPLACLRLTYAADGALTHRDVLGALMGLGLDRDRIGDILADKGQAQVLVLRENAAFVAGALTQVGRVKVKTTEMNLAEVTVPPQRTRTLRDTVASPRLDSVLAAGLNLSREKAASLIRTGQVQLNHAGCQKPDRLTQPGDVLSVRGFGKLKLDTLGEPTRKGRYPITLLRYE